MWLFYYFNFKRNYDTLKLKSPCILLNKNTNFNKKKSESKMENPTCSFRVTNLGLQVIKELQIKSNTVMSWLSCWFLKPLKAFSVSLNECAIQHNLKSTFWVPLSFWSKFKKLPPSFWEPSILVYVNCNKHFKMKVLCFALD